jgi:hypothetical protein
VWELLLGSSSSLPCPAHSHNWCLKTVCGLGLGVQCWSTEGQLLVGGGILGWLGYGRAAGDEDEDEKQRSAALDEMQIAAARRPWVRVGLAER